MSFVVFWAEDVFNDNVNWIFFVNAQNTFTIHMEIAVDRAVHAAEAAVYDCQ
jgi:hypothetical protein